jgi:predicted nucleic acid-binding protein
MSTRKDKPVLDTNILVRFITEDNPKQAGKVRELLEKSRGEFFIPDLVISEIAYVLTYVYKIPKREIINKLRILIDFEKFDTNEKMILRTLEIFEQNKISFNDSYILALNKLGKTGMVYTFDKKMSKVPGVKVKIPS